MLSHTGTVDKPHNLFSNGSSHSLDLFEAKTNPGLGLFELSSLHETVTSGQVPITSFHSLFRSDGCQQTPKTGIAHGEYSGNIGCMNKLCAGKNT